MKFDLQTAQKIWEHFGDVPVDEDDNIDEDFEIPELDVFFEKGTDKFEVWHWFEETFDISVAKDLMFLN